MLYVINGKLAFGKIENAEELGITVLKTEDEVYEHFGCFSFDEGTDDFEQYLDDLEHSMDICEKCDIHVGKIKNPEELNFNIQDRNKFPEKFDKLYRRFCTEYDVWLNEKLNKNWKWAATKTTLCGCGKDHLNIINEMIINWKGKDWSPSCAFKQLLEEIK